MFAFVGSLKLPVSGVANIEFSAACNKSLFYLFFYVFCIFFVFCIFYVYNEIVL